MQHGWLGKPGHPFYVLFMFWRKRRRRQCKQAKRPALAHIYTQNIYTQNRPSPMKIRV